MAVYNYLSSLPSVYRFLCINLYIVSLTVLINLKETFEYLNSQKRFAKNHVKKHALVMQRNAHARKWAKCFYRRKILRPQSHGHCRESGQTNTRVIAICTTESPAIKTQKQCAVRGDRHSAAWRRACALEQNIDRSSGEGNAIGRVRQSAGLFPLQILNQLACDLDIL